MSLYPDPLHVVSWNPISGCTKISEGCAHCWAATAAKRQRQEWGHVEMHPDRLDQPLRRRKPTVYAVAFMGDWVHDEVPDDFIDKVFAVMALTPQHTYLLLTKRPERMRAYLTMPNREPRSGSSTRNLIALTCLGMGIDDLAMNPRSKLGDGLMLNDDGLVNWPLPNVFLGVSCENQERADERIPLLLDTPAAHRWISCEPLLGPIDLSRWLLPDALLPDFRTSISWVVLGGESGPRARPFDLQWARDVRDQCKTAGVPYFCKQMGSVWAKEQRQISGTKGWPDSKGENWDYWGHPDLRTRELPEELKR